jgi:hypothetical protein
MLKEINAKEKGVEIHFYDEDDSSSSGSSGLDIELPEGIMDIDTEKKEDAYFDYADNKKGSSSSILEFLKGKSRSSINVVANGKECYMDF